MPSLKQESSLWADLYLQDLKILHSLKNYTVLLRGLSLAHYKLFMVQFDMIFTM